MSGPQKVLWVWAHPDDETIAGGLSLRQHLEEGLECHVLVCTRGTASSMLATLNGEVQDSDWGLLHDPAAEGYTPFDTDGVAFGAARMRELGHAMGCLLAHTAGILRVHELVLQDGAVTQADVYAGILALIAEIADPGEVVWLKGHSDLVTSAHPDHTQVGKAIRQAANDFPVTLGVNPRFYIDPPWWSYTSTALPAAAKHNILPAVGSDQAAATLNAFRAYNSWSPDPDPSKGTYAIGRQSVPGEWISSRQNTYHG